GLVLYVVRRDLPLVLEPERVELPERLRLLLLRAGGGDGALLCPRMEGKRIVLVVELDLVAVVRQHLLLDRLVALAAERALEVGVLDDRDLRVLGTLV